MWNNLKEHVNEKKSGTPQNILINGVLHNSPAKIANYANSFFIKKKLEKNFHQIAMTHF